MECLTTVSYSYLINDHVYGLVHPSREIRQGDPLSPHLFILKFYPAYARTQQRSVPYRELELHEDIQE